MLQFLATMSVHGWLPNARLVRKLHGSIYLEFKWTLHEVPIIIDIIEFTFKVSFLII